LLNSVTSISAKPSPIVGCQYATSWALLGATLSVGIFLSAARPFRARTRTANAEKHERELRNFIVVFALKQQDADPTTTPRNANTARHSRKHFSERIGPAYCGQFGTSFNGASAGKVDRPQNSGAPCEPGALKIDSSPAQTCGGNVKRLRLRFDSNHPGCWKCIRSYPAECTGASEAGLHSLSESSVSPNENYAILKRK
jgi:hypothetical protein